MSDPARAGDPTRATLTIGQPQGGVLSVGCDVQWDRERGQWRAKGDGVVVYGDLQEATVLAFFAKRLSMVPGVRGVLDALAEAKAQ